MVDYSERLHDAMRRAGKDAKQLADRLGVSYQAVKKVLDGKTRAFTAANNEDAAEYLDVRSRWLAKGTGPRSPYHVTEPRREHFANQLEASYIVENPAETDPWMAEAQRILKGLNEADRRAAVLQLRVFVAQLRLPGDGQALPVAA